MDAKVKTRLAMQIVEATISEVSGHFRKDHNLKRFYRELQNGASRAFVILRDDDEDFVGLLIWERCADLGFHIDTGSRLKAQLWVNLDNREKGLSWVQELKERFRAIDFESRSPQNPLALARSMGLTNR